MEDRRRLRKTFSRLGLAYAVFLILSVVLQMIVAVGFTVLSMLGIGSAPEQSWMILLAMLPMYFVCAPIAWLIVKDMPAPCRPEKQKFSAKKLAVCFVICISVMYIGNMIGIILMGAVNSIQGKPFMNPINEIVQSLDLWMVFLLMVVFAPIVEELLCRKLLIDRTRQFGDRTAILLSGLIFGLMHGNFYQFFYAFGLGIIFAWIYTNTGRIGYTIAFHAVINFMGSIVALKVAENDYIASIYGFFLLAMVILGIIFMIRCRKQVTLAEGPEELPPKGRFSVIFLNAGMLLFFLASCGMFAMTQMG